MKERPILFTGEMVRAILDGRKTQTRRPFKFRETNQPPSRPELFNPKHVTQPAPLGTIGDRLWVRETFRIYRSSVECACYDNCRCASMDGKPLYRASDPSPDDDKWTPSIHMPRWASRIDLEITAVRVERVRDISDDDAESEGVDLRKLCGCQDGCATCDDRSPKEVFRDLWQSIYGNWDANPWVWVYEFRRIKP